MHSEHRVSDTGSKTDTAQCLWHEGYRAVDHGGPRGQRTARLYDTHFPAASRRNTSRQEAHLELDLRNIFSRSVCL